MFNYSNLIDRYAALVEAAAVEADPQVKQQLQWDIEELGRVIDDARLKN